MPQPELSIFVLSPGSLFNSFHFPEPLAGDPSALEVPNDPIQKSQEMSHSASGSFGKLKTLANKASTHSPGL